MVSCRMSRLAWFEMRSASRTCMSQVLPTTVATGVSARSSSARLRSAGARARAPSRAEGRDLRMPQAQLLDLAEERGIALVRAGPAALDVVDAEIVEALGDFELVLDRERNVLRLTSVAQRGVVDLDLPVC